MPTPSVKVDYTEKSAEMIESYVVYLRDNLQVPNIIKDYEINWNKDKNTISIGDLDLCKIYYEDEDKSSTILIKSSNYIKSSFVCNTKNWLHGSFSFTETLMAISEKMYVELRKKIIAKIGSPYNKNIQLNSYIHKLQYYMNKSGISYDGRYYKIIGISNDDVIYFYTNCYNSIDEMVNAIKNYHDTQSETLNELKADFNEIQNKDGGWIISKTSKSNIESFLAHKDIEPKIEGHFIIFKCPYTSDMVSINVEKADEITVKERKVNKDGTV